MKGWLLYILSYAVALLAYTSCDIHEFPVESQDVIPLTIHLDFDSTLPLYTTIYYSRSQADGAGQDSKHNIRYIVNAYRTDNVVGDNRTADTTFIFTKSNINELDYTSRIELPNGTYRLLVWADYVDDGSKADKYYNTSNFAEITLANKNNHTGNSDYRDVFRGENTIKLNSLEENIVTIDMVRPVGKFKFIATDGEEYINRIEDFKVIIRYNHFMPCSFNMFTDKAADSWTNISFSSNMQRENNSEISLGYDYIFVNDTQTSLCLSVDIYNKDGTLFSSSPSINVPIVRNKLTIVKGAFFTANSVAGGGTTISPVYDGEDFNIPI